MIDTNKYCKIGLNIFRTIVSVCGVDKWAKTNPILLFFFVTKYFGEQVRELGELFANSLPKSAYS